MGSIFSRLICTAAGVLYPGYATFKAIKQDDKEEQSHWLKYWAIYSFATTAEVAADYTLWWFPGYYLAKAGFLIYLMHPKTRGASKLFNTHLQPFLNFHEKDIDARLANLHKAVKGWIEKSKKEGAKMVQKKLAEMKEQIVEELADTYQKQQGGQAQPIPYEAVAVEVREETQPATAVFVPEEGAVFIHQSKVAPHNDTEDSTPST